MDNHHRRRGKQPARRARRAPEHVIRRRLVQWAGVVDDDELASRCGVAPEHSRPVLERIIRHVLEHRHRHDAIDHDDAGLFREPVDYRPELNAALGGVRLLRLRDRSGAPQ